MTDHEAREILREHKVEIGIDDRRSIIEIGLAVQATGSPRMQELVVIEPMVSEVSDE